MVSRAVFARGRICSVLLVEAFEEVAEGDIDSILIDVVAG